MHTADLITTGEAARILGCSTRTVQRRIEAGDLPYVAKLAGAQGHWLLDRDVIEAKARADAA